MTRDHVPPDNDKPEDDAPDPGESSGEASGESSGRAVDRSFGARRASPAVVAAKWTILAVASAVALYVAVLVYAGGHALLGSLWLVFYAVAAYVYAARRALTYRYLFPGLAGMAVFVGFPIVFTMWLGFTEYSSANLLTFDRATSVLLSVTFERGEARYDVTLHEVDGGYRLVLVPEGAALPGAATSGSIFDDDGGGSGGGGGSIFDDPAPDARPAPPPGDAGASAGAGAGADAGPRAGAAGGDGSDAAGGDGPGRADAPAPVVYVTEPVALSGAEPVTVAGVALADAGFTPGTALPISAVIDRQDALGALTVRLPDGTLLVKATLRTFAAEQPQYVRNPDGTLTDQKTGAVYAPNFDTGFYQTPDGDRVTPGFRVFVGFKHYARMLTDTSFQQPFLRIFVWTVAFAGFTVLFTLIVGALLAELLQWEGLRFKGLYRVLLFVPYAVPGFISILVFKGLFNSNFGEINTLLEMIVGVKPTWFESPALAKVMLLVVNTWLGYPYIMLLWMGLRQSIPSDLYEASALAGAGPFTNFFKITWPLIRRPLTPLLVSSFAFNFNNFVLINLLTDGRPDFLDTSVPAGTTDILVSYTYRIAFQDTGKNFGLAAAISTVIFFMVAALSLLNLRLTNRDKDRA